MVSKVFHFFHFFLFHSFIGISLGVGVFRAPIHISGTIGTTVTGVIIIGATVTGVRVILLSFQTFVN